MIDLKFSSNLLELVKDVIRGMLLEVVNKINNMIDRKTKTPKGNTN